MKPAYLVDHHNSQEVAESSEEQAIQVMLDIVANDIAELVQENLTNNEDQHTEGDMPKWPAVIQSVGNEKQLHGQVNSDGNSV
jgi:hypothetical protein